MVGRRKVLGWAALIIPLAASMGQGALSDVTVSLGTLQNSDAFVQFVDVYSQAYGYTQNGLGGSSEDFHDGASIPYIASANANGLSPQARATAQTNFKYVTSHTYADTSGGTSSRAWAWASQDWLLNVTTPEDGTFTAPYTIAWDLESGAGETATGDAYWGLFLYDTTVNSSGELVANDLVASSWLPFSLVVSNGDSSLFSYPDAMTLKYEFSSAGAYDLKLMVDPESTAAPLPGAVLLGSLGLGVSGWLLRRRERSVPA